MAITKLFLSNAPSNGGQIKVAATASVGTPIHAAVASPSKDEVYLEAVNTSASPVTLTLEFGGVASPDDLIVVVIQPNVGLVVVLDHGLLAGGKIIGAFASAGDVINIQGYVLRDTP